MNSSLAVAQAEMLQVIESLERVVAGLQDVNAGVSKYGDELHRLRERVLQVRSPSRWRVVFEVGREVLERIAVELLKTWL